MKASRKRLKADLALGFRKLGPLSLASKLGEFPLFDEFFLGLADFQDLNVFSLFEFPDLDDFFDFFDFLACSTLLQLNPSTSSLPLFLLRASLMLSFLQEAGLLLSFLLEASLLGDQVIFNIEVSRAAILLKPWINHQ